MMAQVVAASGVKSERRIYIFYIAFWRLLYASVVTDFHSKIDVHSIDAWKDNNL